MSRTQSIALAVIAIVAVAAGMLLSRAMLERNAGAPPVAVTGTLVDPPRPLPPLNLVDHDGNAFGAARLRGRWSLLFFGFTNCPDVCPATLTALAQTEKLLADLPAAARPQVVLVSVDPQRDTPQRLSAYVRSFSPSFVGTTAEQSAVDELARQIGVLVSITKQDGGDYQVEHSAAVLLIDAGGALHALFSPPHTPQLIADDYRRIVAPAGA